MCNVVFWKVNKYCKVRKKKKQFNVNKILWMRAIWDQLFVLGKRIKDNKVKCELWI